MALWIRRALSILLLASTKVLGTTLRSLPRLARQVTPEEVLDGKYDFVIAGGGTSGLTLADRLSEDSSVTVLVIEAGPFDKGEEGLLIPGVFNPWQYVWPDLNSVPQTELRNKSFSAPCGRVVGGGSAVNAMVFLRGNKVEYDAWAELGSDGWGWDSLLPYFRKADPKSENFTRPDIDFATAANIRWQDDAHGAGGPVQNSYPNYFYPGSTNWWNAVRSVGIAATTDPNGGVQNGIFAFPSALNPVTMSRSYARINHYDRVKESRPNYHILAQHTVSRVVFENSKAVAVEYLPSNGGNKTRVAATKEIILAAGALHTPQILQLSGVGPQKLLKKYGIEVVSDLSGVGQNFQDQASARIQYNFTSNLFPNAGSLDSNATFDREQRALYDSSRRGAYTIVRTLGTSLATVPFRNATSKYKESVQALRRRDPALFLPPDTDPSVLKGYIAQREILLRELEGYDVPIGMIHWTSGETVTMYFFKPLSRGSVNINSTDPLANPVIDFRTATEPVDLDMAVALVRKNREIMNAPTMKVLGPAELAPFGEGLAETDGEIKKALREVINPSTAHECCTASMLPLELGGVLDSRMRVYGVEGLRVVDSSYWPMEISAAPTATMYATGEKLADIIKTQYCLAGYCD